MAIGVGLGALVRRFEVTGASMEPTYVAGDRLLVLVRGRKPRVGDVVVFVDPRQSVDTDPTEGAVDTREMVKRVTAVHADGSVAVAGDNPQESTDSRSFGPVPAKLLRGRVLRTY